MTRRYGNISSRKCFSTAVLLALLAVAGACRSQPAEECRWSDDCPDGEFCRLGSCTIVTGAVDTAEPRRAGSPASPQRESGPGDATVDRGASTADATFRPEPCPGGRAPNAGELVLNELLAHVPSGPAGDANGDGKRDPFDDEFVEFVNRSDAELDLSGVRLVESGEAVATLEDVCLSAGGVLVVFGGVTSGASPDLTGSAETVVSPTRFGFANSGGSFRAVRSDGAELASFRWNSAPPESYTLSPQLEGDTYRPHTELAANTRSSPGRCPDGTPLADGCPGRNDDAGLDARSLDAGR